MRCGTIVLASALGLVSCQQSGILAPRPPNVTRVWVATEPMQCLGNPWEQDWLASHNGDYGSYPKDPTQPGLGPEEFAIIRDFYRRQGVTVFEATTRPRYQVVCLACSCPEGHTLYLEVRRVDLQAMLSFGYRQESPGWS